MRRLVNEVNKVNDNKYYYYYDKYNYYYAYISYSMSHSILINSSAPMRTSMLQIVGLIPPPTVPTPMTFSVQP